MLHNSVLLLINCAYDVLWTWDERRKGKLPPSPQLNIIFSSWGNIPDGRTQKFKKLDVDQSNDNNGIIYGSIKAHEGRKKLEHKTDERLSIR